MISFSELGEQFSFANILDNIDAGVIVYDACGNFLFVNTVMINWRNIPRTEYLKMNVKDFYQFFDVCVYDLVLEKKQRISRLQYYTDCQRIDNQKRMRIVTGTPIFDEIGNIKYVIVFLQDIDSFEMRYKALLKEHSILSNPSSENQQPVKERKMIVKSQQVIQILEIAKGIASTDATVLLYGESGSGKELFADYIYTHSKRNKQPLITVNCAALPENLAEAELFGYEKGSFTGANKEGKIGLVEAADGGTLFLDEINSLPMSIQGKLLRAIEEKNVQRIGANKAKKIDFRLIVATNQNLLEKVQQGSFREDLYYRINVVPITVPPLRERREDIIPLCLYFLQNYCQKYNLVKTFSDQMLSQIEKYTWPGNVRELRNFVERMIVMTPSEISVIHKIPEGLLENKSEATDFSTKEPAKNSIKMVEEPHKVKLSKGVIVSALSECGQNRELTARYLGISRRQLQYKIKEYNLSLRCKN